MNVRWVEILLSQVFEEIFTWILALAIDTSYLRNLLANRGSWLREARVAGIEEFAWLKL